jgi:hypothetical protein
MDSLASIGQLIRDAVANASADKFSEAGMELVQARDQINAEVKEHTAKAMKYVIQKLERNQTLSAEEKDLIRLWIVGDAEALTKKENDFQEWLEEFRRLGEAIANMDRMPDSLSEMLDLEGSLVEAARLAGDLKFFLEEKERVTRFLQAIQNLSMSEAKMMADILKEKLSSPEM